MFYNKGDGNRVSTLDRMYDEYLSEIHNAKEDLKWTPLSRHPFSIC